MAPLIRNAGLASDRLKLGHRLPEPAAAKGPDGPRVAAPVAAPDPVDLHALEARLRAELRSEMEKTLVQSREAARQQGFVQGEKQARAQAAASMEREREERQKAFEVALQVLQASVAGAVQSLQRRAADIAFVAVGRIVGAQVATAEFVRSAVETVVRQATGQPLVVRLHPRDLSTLRGSEDAAALLANESLMLREDPALACGGCIVDSPIGSIDASFETQLRLLRDLLQGGRAP